MFSTSKPLSILTALLLACVCAKAQSGNTGGIKTTNSPFAGAVLLTDGSKYYWGSATNLSGNATNAQPPSSTLTNLSGTGAATNVHTESLGMSNSIVFLTAPESRPGLQYWDNFQRPLSSSGVVPQSPSGHDYRLIGNPAALTNFFDLRNGFWNSGSNGALYLSVSNNNSGVIGSSKRYNQFGGIFRYDRSTNNTVDGVERNLGFALSSNSDFIAKSPLFLHVGINVAGVQVQRELSATNFINEPYPNGDYLAYGTNYSFTLTIISNTITVEVGGHKFQKTDPAVGLYGNFTVVTWESQGTPTNQFWGRWGHQWAGYASALENVMWGGPFKFGTNGSLDSIRFSDGTTQTTAYTGGGGGGGGAGSLPMNPNQFDTNTTVSLKDGALTTNLNVRTALTLPHLTTGRAATINGSGQVTNSTVTEAELAFVSGVTSALQTQLNGKMTGATNANQFGASTTLTLKDGLLGTNWTLRGVTLPTLTASRPAIIDASGNLTNATGTPDGTKFLRDDGTLAVPSGSGSGSTNPVAFTAGSIGVSNYFGLGFTNTGSNAVQVIDMMGPQLVRSFANGNTTLVLTNMPSWTNAQYGGRIQIQLRHGSGTVTLASWHPVNFGRSFFIASGETNLIDIYTYGAEVLGSLSHEPAEVNTSYSSVVEIDQSIGQAVVFNLTNRVTGNLSLVLTNPVSSRQLRINVIGEASGGTDRTVTMIPNTSSFVVNMGTFAQSKTNSFVFTLTNKNAAEITSETVRLNGTNLWKVSVNQYSFE